MPLNNKELLKAAEMVAEINDVKVAVSASGLCALFTAATTFFGGLVAGPVGLLFGMVSARLHPGAFLDPSDSKLGSLCLGATGGGLASFAATKNRFKSVPQAVKDNLTPRQRDQLAEHLARAIQDVEITDFIYLMAVIQSNGPVAQLLLTALKGFLEKECQMTCLK